MIVLGRLSSIGRVIILLRAMERKGKEKEWRNSVEACYRCGYSKLLYHQDGVQCLNCNQITYMPALDEGDSRELSSKTRQLIGSKTDTVKPVNWHRMTNHERRIWHDAHRETIICDYENMPVFDVLTKWQIGSTTLTYLRKRWGVPKKRGCIKQSAVVV